MPFVVGDIVKIKPDAPYGITQPGTIWRVTEPETNGMVGIGYRVGPVRREFIVSTAWLEMIGPETQYQVSDWKTVGSRLRYRVGT
jgi:hypothetical protein